MSSVAQGAHHLGPTITDCKAVVSKDCTGFLGVVWIDLVAVGVAVSDRLAPHHMVHYPVESVNGVINGSRMVSSIVVGILGSFFGFRGRFRTFGFGVRRWT